LLAWSEGANYPLADANMEAAVSLLRANLTERLTQVPMQSTRRLNLTDRTVQR